MAKYFLDTTVLIDHLRGRRAVAELMASLAREGHVLGLCCVNVAELYSGVRPGERPHVDRLVDTLEFYEVSRDVAKEAGRHRYEFARKGVALTLADALIAATAVGHGATLITANARDFPMPGLKVLQQP